MADGESRESRSNPLSNLGVSTTSGYPNSRPVLKKPDTLWDIQRDTLSDVALEQSSLIQLCNRSLAKFAVKYPGQLDKCRRSKETSDCAEVVTTEMLVYVIVEPSIERGI